MSDEITFEIKKPEIIVLFCVLAVVLFMELEVTLNTPISFGDEGFHTRLAQWIAENKEYPTWTYFEGSKLDMKAFGRPPLWNLLEAGFIFVLGFSETLIKVLTPFVSVMTGIAIFVLVKKLYNEKAALIAAIIAIAIPSFVTYSILFYTDILETFYFTLFALTFILAIKNDSWKYFILAALFGALAFLTKVTGTAVYMFVVLAFIYQWIKTRNFTRLFKKYAVFVLISAVLLAPFFIRSYYFYNTPDCHLPLPFFSTNGCSIDNFQDQYQFAGRTENVGTDTSPLNMGLTNYLTFAYGNIWFVMFGLLAGLIAIIYRRNETDILIILALVTMISVVAQSIERAEDLSRYTLSWVPLIALIAASYLDILYNSLKNNRTAALVFLIAVLILIFGYFSYAASLINPVFVLYVWVAVAVLTSAYGLYNYAKKKDVGTAVFVLISLFVVIIGYQAISDKLTTMAQIKQFSPAFFQACDWIKQNTPQDSLIYTVWSHRAIYSCERNAVGSFADIGMSRDLNYTLEVAKEHGITHIFIQKFSIDPQNQHLSEKYDLDFVNFLNNNPDHFKKIYENGLELTQCLSQSNLCDGNILYEIIF